MRLLANDSHAEIWGSTASGGTPPEAAVQFMTARKGNPAMCDTSRISN